MHFAPSKSIEMHVQECGRAGRDNLPSMCIMLYNGLLSANCDKDLKSYVKGDGCRRQFLMRYISVSRLDK